MQYLIINTLIILFSITCVGLMIARLKQQPTPALTFREQRQLLTSGLFAFFMDTIGVGSFACNIALAKYFNSFSDEELPAMVNGAQVIPGALEAIFFLGLIHVDGLTLITLILATCLGGIVGASIIAKLKAQPIRLIMLIAFPTIIFLILSHHIHWLPIGGNKIALQGYELLIGFIGLFFAGILTCAGVGLFALIQAVLFCLGMSPLVAFPIMTAAGALQQPLSTGIFVMKNRVPLKKSLLIGLYGVGGVMLAMPVITHLSITKLHGLLVLVLSYNTIMMGKGYLQHRKRLRAASYTQLINSRTTS
jgi:uncharacterized membrane protein YfcA